MTASVPGYPSPLAPLVDEQRLGSAGGQAVVGIAGIVLAVVLVMGQISLATSKGIAVHLHQSVQNMTKGNQVMESVIERAAPSVELQKVIASQATTLGHTHQAMIKTNQQMAGIGKTTKQLDTVVASMESNSHTLATGVEGMNHDTGRMVDLLGTLPAATDRTHTALARINADTVALNRELAAIAAKMQKYGLPVAAGAKPA